MGSVKFELSLLGFFLACWLVFFALALAKYPLAGLLPLNLYHLYGLALFAGWLLGNVMVQRGMDRVATVRRRINLSVLLVSGGLFYLLWALAPLEVRQAAPFAPLYAVGVFTIFFLLPVSFRKSFPPRPWGDSG